MPIAATRSSWNTAPPACSNAGDEVPKGEQTDFRRAVLAKDDETVVLSSPGSNGPTRRPATPEWKKP